MRPTQIPIPRIHLARRVLRPPNIRFFETSIPRPFSYRSPRLLLISQASPRPQLPFLYPSAQLFANGHSHVSRFFSISANHKKFIKETAKLSVKYSLVFWVISTCFSIASMGFLSERQERAFPSPHEWSLYTRFRFRRAKWWEVPENNEDEGFPNYARLYAEFDIALRRLEDPNKDGRGIIEKEGDLSVSGVGTAAFDLTAKSEEWRQGYFEVLLGMGRAAERLEGWRSDDQKWNVWSPEFIASPDNPRPKATPPGMPPVPPEDKLRVVAEPPEKFYLKILTSTGFTTKQRLAAALAYGDWLSFKKLPESAENMYRWGLDIAISGLPTQDPTLIINPDTAVLSSTAPKEAITPNLIDAATSLATHLASVGSITSALPIYVSILRARLSANVAPFSAHALPPDPSVMGTILSLFNEPQYPSLPPSGNEPFLRREEDMCEEAVLKTYIGEILFATAGPSTTQCQQGLNWIREAVSNSKTAQTLDIVISDTARRKKCQACEEIGLESWGKMMTYLCSVARQKRDSVKAGGLSNLTWKLWGTEKLDEDLEKLEEEEQGVAMRLNSLRGSVLKEEWDEMDRRYARTFVF